MPNNYYYLVASLTYLRFEDAPPLTGAEFLEECAKWLTASDLKKLSTVELNELAANPEDPAMIKEWKAFNRSLREGLAAARQAQKESLHEKYPAELKDIFNEPNPLRMERKFEEKRWNFLEEKETGHHFDLEVLMAYFLKLQIMKRLTAFDAEKGKIVFENLCEIKV
ncbi:MAG: DUF2764 domain-containing protein [Omnitrophica bacterium]|nr:DUF2764 domain-containing protein [Candidatus Omnitrophota bacterium]